MKAICVTCGHEYEVSAEGPLGSCVSCGGVLKRVMAAPPVVNVPPVAGATPVGDGSSSEPANGEPIQEETLGLTDDSAAAGMTCPNCGHWIEPGAQICTACGYSRRLGRTLTTRVGTPEIPKHKAKVAPEPAPEEPEIEAEKEFRRAKLRGRGGGGADALRLFVAVMWLLILGAIVMAAPTAWLKEHVPLVLPELVRPPKFDALNASFMMLMFLGVALPITAIAVRVAAVITNIELNTYFSWLRTAGVLAAVLVTMEIVFTVDQVILHLETRWLLVALAAEAALALLVFTWYLHDVSFSAAIVLWFATLIGAAVGLFTAAAAFAWVGGLLSIGPVIKPVNTWTWPKLTM